MEIISTLGQGMMRYVTGYVVFRAYGYGVPFGSCSSCIVLQVAVVRQRTEACSLENARGEERLLLAAEVEHQRARFCVDFAFWLERQPGLNVTK